MIWALGQDDHNGKSCGTGSYPLLTTISDCLGIRNPKLIDRFTKRDSTTVAAKLTSDVVKATISTERGSTSRVTLPVTGRGTPLPNTAKPSEGCNTG